MMGAQHPSACCHRAGTDPSHRSHSATSGGRMGQTKHIGQLDDSDRSQIQTDDNRSTQR